MLSKEREEAIKTVRKFNQGNRYRDCEKINNSIDMVLQVLENSISKEKVEEGIESIEDYFDRLNGPDEDIEYIRNIKQELLEGK